MKELFKTGGEMPDTNYVFMVRSVYFMQYLESFPSSVFTVLRLYVRRQKLRHSCKNFPRIMPKGFLFGVGLMWSNSGNYHYYAAFTAPCVSHKDDESQA